MIDLVLVINDLYIPVVRYILTEDGLDVSKLMLSPYQIPTRKFCLEIKYNKIILEYELLGKTRSHSWLLTARLRA